MKDMADHEKEVHSYRYNNYNQLLIFSHAI